MTKEAKQVFFNHIADLFLYEYFVAGEQGYELLSEDTSIEQVELAHEWMGDGDYQKALQAWQEVLEVNPVRMDAMQGVIACYKHLRDFDGAYDATKKSYDFCCTRSELAAFYRNLAWYFLETYEPVVAIACNKYSNFFEESEQAKSDIEYLEIALKKSYGDMDLTQIQEVLTEHEIPLQANSVTLALLYKAGIEAYETGNRKQAYDCFCMVYDLTQDEEIKQWMEKTISVG